MNVPYGWNSSQSHVGVFKGRVLGAKHILSFSKTCIFAKSWCFFTDSKTSPFQRQRTPGLFWVSSFLFLYEHTRLILRGRTCPLQKAEAYPNAQVYKQNKAGRKRPQTSVPAIQPSSPHCSGIFCSHTILLIHRELRVKSFIMSC